MTTDTASTYQTTQVTAPQVFVRTNSYDPNRTTLAVYNAPAQDTVDIDVSGVLAVGMAYEVRDVQNYFGTPVISGTYDGSVLHLPMTGLHSAQPTGDWIPATQAEDPKFHVFVLIASS